MNYFILFIYMLLPIYGKSFSIMHPSYNQHKQNSDITLNGIVYVSEKQWIIWINNSKITQSHAPEWLKINQVSESCVHCDYLYNGIWYKVTLEPYETFTPSSITQEDKASSEKT